jgi:hypothetical protein
MPETFDYRVFSVLVFQRSGNGMPGPDGWTQFPNHFLNGVKTLELHLVFPFVTETVIEWDNDRSGIIAQ